MMQINDKIKLNKAIVSRTIEIKCGFNSTDVYFQILPPLYIGAKLLKKDLKCSLSIINYLLF